MYETLACAYDALTEDINYDAWTDRYVSMLPPKAINIAECGCGTGSMTVRFAKRGYMVIASDISREMLNVASGKLRAAGRRNAAVFIKQDMRELSLHKPVDAVVCVNDGVNYLTTPKDVMQFFDRAYACLKPGGRLAFDISSRYKLEHILANDFFGEERADIAYLWQNAYDAETACVVMRLTFFLRQPGGLYARREERHVQRAHDMQEIVKWLKHAGFDGICVSGDIPDAPPAYDDLRLYFTAERALL